MNMKESLLALIHSLPFEVIAAPEVGPKKGLKVSVMSGAERDQFDNAWRSILGNESVQGGGFRALLALFTLRDVDTGERLFELAELDVVNQLPAPLLDRAATVALRINLMTDGAVEKAEKNS